MKCQIKKAKLLLSKAVNQVGQKAQNSANVNTLWTTPVLTLVIQKIYIHLIPCGPGLSWYPTIWTLDFGNVAGLIQEHLNTGLEYF